MLMLKKKNHSKSDAFEMCALIRAAHPNKSINVYLNEFALYFNPTDYCIYSGIVYKRPQIFVLNWINYEYIASMSLLKLLFLMQAHMHAMSVSHTQHTMVVFHTQIHTHTHKHTHAHLHCTVACFINAFVSALVAFDVCVNQRKKTQIRKQK